jgi:hypothetical protein
MRKIEPRQADGMDINAPVSGTLDRFGGDLHMVPWKGLAGAFDSKEPQAARGDPQNLVNTPERLHVGI